jgi:hypothetical protein
MVIKDIKSTIQVPPKTNTGCVWVENRLYGNTDVDHAAKQM